MLKHSILAYYTSCTKTISIWFQARILFIDETIENNNKQVNFEHWTASIPFIYIISMVTGSYCCLKLRPSKVTPLGFEHWTASTSRTRCAVNIDSVLTWDPTIRKPTTQCGYTCQIFVDWSRILLDCLYLLITWLCLICTLCDLFFHHNCHRQPSQQVFEKCTH